MNEQGERLPAKRSAFVEGLAERIGTTARAQTIFGPPVERAGISVIPVAKVRYGFGGGSCRRATDEEGAGGGGGVFAGPVGYIEVRDHDSRFHPIRQPASWIPLVALGGLFGLLIVRALDRLLGR